MDKILMALLFDGLDGEIERLKVQMAMEKDSDKKREIANDIYRLEKVKNEQRTFKIKPADLLKAGVSIAGLILVLKHEETNVITSKMWGIVGGYFK